MIAAFFAWCFPSASSLLKATSFKRLAYAGLHRLLEIAEVGVHVGDGQILQKGNR
jgi:hypothetical protein